MSDNNDTDTISIIEECCLRWAIKEWWAIHTGCLPWRDRPNWWKVFQFSPNSFETNFTRKKWKWNQSLWLPMWGMNHTKSNIWIWKWDWANLAMIKIFSALKKLPTFSSSRADTKVSQLPWQKAISGTIHLSILFSHPWPLEVAQSSMRTLHHIYCLSLISSLHHRQFDHYCCLEVCTARTSTKLVLQEWRPAYRFSNNIVSLNVPFCLFSKAMTISSGTQATVAGYPLPAQRNCVSYWKEFITSKRLNITEICYVTKLCCSKRSSELIISFPWP